MFGYIVYVYILKEKRSKVNKKACKGIFMGYIDLLRIYLVYNPARRKIIKATIVTFNESRKYNLGMTEEH